MDHPLLHSNERDYLLDYSELIEIAPELKETLSEEASFEFSQQLYELTKIIYRQYKNDKKKYNTK